MHSPQILAHTDRTTWPNKIRLFHLHRCQICFYINKIHRCMQCSWNKLEAAAPEHQQMNGICEANWRKVHNTANILLITAQLGRPFFHHAHAYAIHIVNSCTVKNVTDKDGNPTTPYQCSYGRKPTLANFRVFGCPVYFKRYVEQVDYLQTTTSACIQWYLYWIPRKLSRLASFLS
jgi:hypothetical protein